MTRLIQRWIASAMLSMSIVGATVGMSYGQEKVVRIGFQKYGKLVLLKSKGTLEEKLKSSGYKVVWTEFPSGPPLLEALNVGAIDFGNTGEAPPIFAQAAGAPFSMSPMSRRRRRARRSWCQRTASLIRSPTSRAGRSR